MLILVLSIIATLSVVAFLGVFVRHIVKIESGPRRSSEAQLALNDTLWLDTNDACNLKCPTCIRGQRGMVNTGHRLALEKFDAIVQKAAAEGYKKIGVFNWTEPFLNPDLAKYMEVIKRRGLFAMVSTNFSLRKIAHLEAALKNTDLIFISVSGFDQAVYEINHVGGNIEYVKENVRRAASLKARGLTSTCVMLRFLKFPYNHDQETKLSNFATDLAINFETVPGSGDPFAHGTGATNEMYKAMVNAHKPGQTTHPAGKVCPLMFGQMPIDSKGDVYLCCGYPNYEALKISPYLDMPQEKILLRRYNHPVCASCPTPRRDATELDKQALLEAMAS